ncbi:MAG: M28 family metallopeptidase [Pseudomonadota bacterium]
MRLVFCLLLAAGLAACTDAPEEASNSADSAGPAIGPLLENAQILPANAVSIGTIKAITQELADDRYEGRAPATPGGDLSEAYLASMMKEMGFAPGNGDSYLQSVPMVSIALEPERSSVKLSGGGVGHMLKYRDEIVYHTRRVVPSVRLEASELVFVGYGIVAPEYGWDDYAGVDVTGKTVVMLVNDPGFATKDPDVFKGKAMTYYGRWTYKYEEASRQGAAGALIIHQSAPASYGWSVVETGWSGPQLDLKREDGNASRVAMEGWVSEDFAKELFAAGGLDFGALTAAAAAPNFKAVDMGELQIDAVLTNQLDYVTASNVIGIIKGSRAPDEAILYTAHFDHLGKTDVAEGEDGIFNGAVDNAVGTAAIMAIGEAFAKAPTPPERSVIIAAFTAEESGLLGSAYFAEHPPVPLSKMIGGINLDAILPTTKARDVTVTGLGASELEEVLGFYAGKAGVTLSAEATPEAGLFYRSDHISLSKVGVPMLYLDEGLDLVDGGIEAGKALSDAYYSGPYHQVTDKYDPAWPMENLEQVTALAYQTGNALVRTSLWPNWFAGNEFKGLRDAMRAQQ